MKNLNFKNFNYAMIDSARSGYREVLVTYTVDGQTARKCVFVKEVKGKDKNYYLAQAKKEINASIKDGSLAKSASKQLARGGATKPVLITLSCLLAAGALGTGGYFLGSYLGGGNGGGDVTGHTVILDAGEGTFADDQPYLILNGIKDGTALGDVEGYTLPTYENWDFDKWEGIDGPGESYKITTDLLLTATYIQGINYTRDVAKTALYNKMQEIIATQPDAQSSVQKIYDSTMKAIGDQTLADNKNGIKVVQELQQFALDTMDLIGKRPDMKGIDTIYEADINDLIKTQNDNKRFMLAKLYAAYLKGCSYGVIPVTDSMLDSIFEEGIKTINGMQDEDLARLYAHTYAGLELIASLYTSKEDIQKVKDTFIKKTDEVYESKAIRKGDVTSLDWIGEMLYNGLAASVNAQIQVKYTSVLNNYFQKGLKQAIEALKSGDAYLVGYANISSYVVKAVANVDVKQKGYWPSDQEFNDAIGECIYSYENCFAEYETRVTPKEKVISMVTEIFKIALEAFVTYPGDSLEDFQSLLYGETKSNDVIGFVATATSYLGGLAPLTDLYFSDFYSYVANDITKIAQNKKEEKKVTGNYASLFYNTQVLFNSMSNNLVNPSFATSLKQMVWDIIDLSVDSDYVYDTNNVDAVMSALCGQLKPNNKDYLTKVFVSAFKGTNKMYTELKINTQDYYTNFANLIGYEVIDNLMKVSTSVTEKFVNFVCSFLSDYGVAYFDGCYTSTSSYEGSMGSLANLVNGMLPLVYEQIIAASNLPEEIFDSYLEAYNELFAMLPKLVRHNSQDVTANLMKTFTDFLVQPVECYKAVMNNENPKLADKVPLLTNAMKENLIDKVTDVTTAEQFEQYVKTTSDEMKKIIS